MQIRYATEADLPQIVDIYNAAIPGRQATADLEPITVDSRKQWFVDHPPDRYPIWVVTSASRPAMVDAPETSATSEIVLGWLSLQLFYGRIAYRATAEVSVYVAPAAQGQGVGKALLSHAIAASPQLEIQTLVSFIFGHNTPSLRLFEQWGFQPWGCLPQVAILDGVERDLLILGRRLAGG